MERKLKKELAIYFEAPKPVRKRAFVQQFGMPKMNPCYVIFMQAKYISKWVWIASLLFFGGAILLTWVAEPKYISMFLGCIPFLVMFSVTESMRSYRYGMEELELSARFSLKSIVLARMLMLGIGNMVVLLGAVFVLRSSLQISIAYVMTPYFLTAGGGLWIVRRVRSKENNLYCFALAALVSASVWYLPWQFKAMYAAQNVWMWAGACIIGIVITVRESFRTIRMTEDLAWN